MNTGELQEAWIIAELLLDFVKRLLLMQLEIQPVKRFVYV